VTQPKILSLKPQLIANPNSTFFKKSGYTAIVCDLSQGSEPKYCKQLKQSELLPRDPRNRNSGLLSSHPKARKLVYAQQWLSLSRDLHRAPPTRAERILGAG